MSKIEFNMQNWEKCICSGCPTQAESMCVKEKKMKAMEMMPKIKESKMMPKPEMVPGVYCANGKSTCDDSDFTKMCICNECLVWKENNLANGQPMGYFCRDGEAK